jgi:hypothetical protein
VKKLVQGDNGGGDGGGGKLSGVGELIGDNGGGSK